MTGGASSQRDNLSNWPPGGTNAEDGQPEADFTEDDQCERPLRQPDETSGQDADRAEHDREQQRGVRGQLDGTIPGAVISYASW